MENYVELISIPAISVTVYWLIEVIKYTVNGNEKFKRLIPLISLVIGSVFGVVCFYFIPNIIPTDNVLLAIVIGGASGLTATGTNQIFKQLKNNNTIT